MPNISLALLKPTRRLINIKTANANMKFSSQNFMNMQQETLYTYSLVPDDVTNCPEILLLL